MNEAVLSLSPVGINLYAALYFIVGASIATLGFAALFFEKRPRVKIPFLCMSLSAAFWLLCYGLLFLSRENDPLFQLYLCKIAHIGVSFIPGFILLFVSSVFQAPKWFKAWAHFSMGVSAFFCVINLTTHLWFWEMYQYPWGAYPRYEPFADLFLAFFFTALISAIVALGY